MKLRYVIFILLIFLFGYLLRSDLKCVNYNGDFHYSSVVVSFHLKELIATEEQTPLFFVRFFHNRITVSAFDIFARYIQFFNIFYLVNILGLAGLFSFLHFYYQFFAKEIKNKLIKILAVLVLLSPFLEIFQLIGKTFSLKMLILIIPYQIASLAGFFYFSKREKYIWLTTYLILLMLSIGWIVVFGNELLSFCTTS